MLAPNHSRDACNVVTSAGNGISTPPSNSESSDPETLLIASTDPVLDSTLFEQFKSRRIVTWRNRGPVVPPFGSQNVDLAAVLEHAVLDLGVREIAICGHLPNDAAWSSARDSVGATENHETNYFAAIHHIVKARYGHLEAVELMRAIVEENVFSQSANLRTYPVVKDRLANGHLKLHNWIYDTSKDQLFRHDPVNDPFKNRIERKSTPDPQLRPYLNPCEIYLA